MPNFFKSFSKVLNLIAIIFYGLINFIDPEIDSRFEIQNLFLYSIIDTFFIGYFVGYDIGEDY